MLQYCDFCKGNLEFIYKVDDYNIFYCRHCKMAFKKDIKKNVRGLSELYESDYLYSISDYFAYESVLERALRQVSYLPADVKPGRLLDVGCSKGYFLKSAKDKGWQPYGVDISNAAAKYAKDNFGLPVSIGQLESVDFPLDFFDGITMWDVFEHLPDPGSALSLAYRWLKPGGFLILETPNFNSIYRVVTRRHWCGFAKYHLYYFSIFALTGLLRRHGFKICKIETPNINFFSKEGMWRFRMVNSMDSLKTFLSSVIGKFKTGRKTIEIHEGRLRNGRCRSQGERRKNLTRILNCPTNFIFGYFKLGDQIRITAKKVS